MSAASDRPGEHTPPRWLLPVVLLAALVLRLISWDQTLVMMNDGADFLWQAERILDGDWQTAVAHHYHPGYGAVIAAASVFSDDLLAVAAGVSIFGGVLMVLAAWGLGRLAFPRQPMVAACTAMVAAGHNRFVHQAADIHPEGLFLGLFAVAAWCAWRSPLARRPAAWMFTAGVLTGFGFLLRQEALILGLPLVLWWVAGRLRLTAPSPSLRGLVGFGLGLLLGLAPYSMAIHEMTGVWALSLKPSMAGFALGDLPRQEPPGLRTSPHFMPVVPRLAVVTPPMDADARAEADPDAESDADADAETDAGGESGAVPVKRGALGPQAVLLTIGDMLPRSWHPLEKTARTLRIEGMILLAFGIAAGLRRRRGMVLMTAAVVGTYLVLLAGHVARHGFLSDRHVLIVLVLLLPLLGAGAHSMACGEWRAHAGALRRRGVTILLALITVSLLLGSVWPRRTESEPRLRALEWVRSHVPEDEGIGVRRRRDSWYADRHVITLRFPCDKQTLLTMMDTHRIACLIVDLEHYEEHLAPWVDDGTFVWWEHFEARREADDPVIVLRRPRRL